MSDSTRVLFIDDELHWHQEIRDSLAPHRIDVECVRELEPAIEMLRREVFPVALVDRQFANEMDRGLDIIADLRRQFPELECILLTSYYDAPSSIAALQRDAYSAVKKRDLPTLLSEIRNAKFKHSLRQTNLDRGSLQPLIESTKLRQFGDDLSRIDDPTDNFLEAILVAFVLSSSHALNSDTLNKLISGSSLAARIPSLQTLDDEAIEQLADLSRIVIDRANHERLVRVAASNDCALAVNENELIRIWMSKLDAPSDGSMIDAAKLAWLRDLLRGDRGLLPLAARTSVQLLLGICEQPNLSRLNMPSLIEFRASKHLPKVRELLDLLQRHDQIDPYRRELDLLSTLVNAHQRYSALCEIAEYPLDALDWLETYCDDLAPMLADTRRLFADQTAYPALHNPIEKCNILVSRFNAKFVEFIWNSENGYRTWSDGGQQRLLRTPEIVERALVPSLQNFKRVLFVIFDGMSYLSWLRIRRKLTDTLFAVETEQAAYAVIPSATRFARSAIFAGQFPREFMPASWQGNPNERRLLNDALKRLGTAVRVGESEFLKYEERNERDDMQKQEKELQELLDAGSRLSVVIFDPHDKVTHLSNNRPEDFAELFYNVSVHPVMERIAQLPDTAVVIAVDHGFCEIQRQAKVNGIFRTGRPRRSDTHYAPTVATRRGHFGKRYIDLDDREFEPRQSEKWVRCIDDPEKWGLPDSNGYVIAVGDCGFSTDESAVRMFAHGGVSLEEMIVPVVTLKTKSGSSTRFTKASP